MSRRLCCMLVATLCTAGTAGAGPPLQADDPHTVGPGTLEAIAAVAGFGFESSTDVLAPIVDLTLGLFDGVDLALAAAPAFSISQDAPVESSGAVNLMVKWQPLRGGRWNAAFTPGVSVNVPYIDAPAIMLPVQIEYDWASAFLGFDAGYAVGIDAPDLWFAILYGGVAASERLTLLAEVWVGERLIGDRSAAGLSLGFA